LSSSSSRTERLASSPVLVIAWTLLSVLFYSFACIPVESRGTWCSMPSQV
jgi:hypothetical protein